MKIKHLFAILTAIAVFALNAFANEAKSAVAANQGVTATAAAQSQVNTANGLTATAKVLTYDDCYKMASENNRDFRMAKLDKTIAESEMQKGIAAFGPSISVSGGYEPVNVQAPEVFQPGTMNYEIFAKMLGLPPDSTAPISLSLIPAYYYMAQVTFSQPIFTFGKTFFGFKIAEESYKIAQIKFRKAEQKLTLDVISAFYGALIAQELNDAQQEALRANEEYLRITKTKYANGQASNFDVLQAQVQYSNSVPDAKKAQDGVMLATQALKNTLGMPLDQEITLSGTTEFKKFEMAYDEIKNKFKEKNNDREMVEAAANIAKYNKDLQAAMLLPNIGLTANYNYTSADPAFHHETWDWQSSWSVMIGMQWQIFNSFKNVADVREADAGAEKAKLNKENTDNLLTIQLDQLYTSMEESRQVIEAADDLIKQAQEGYRIAKESYKNGLIQSVDLLNSETGLLRAKINYLNAMLNYITTAQTLRNFVE